MGENNEVKTVYAGPVLIRYFPGDYTDKEMRQAANYFRDISEPAVLSRMDASQDEGPWIAVLTDEPSTPLNKGVLGVNGRTANFVAAAADNVFNVLSQMNGFLKTIVYIERVNPDLSPNFKYDLRNVYTEGMFNLRDVEAFLRGEDPI
jgi:hypothetical protein